MNKNNKGIKEFIDRINKKEPALKQVNLNKKFIIDKVGGDEIIINASSIFKSGVDARFEEYQLCSKDEPTLSTEVFLYETIRKTKFSGVFFGNLDELCFTQNQIIKFCKKYLNYLKKDGRTTLFLYKKNEDYFVIGIYRFFDGLDVCVNPFNIDVPLGSCGHRVVSPKKIIIKKL